MVRAARGPGWAPQGAGTERRRAFRSAILLSMAASPFRRGACRVPVAALVLLLVLGVRSGAQGGASAPAASAVPPVPMAPAPAATIDPITLGYYGFKTPSRAGSSQVPGLVGLDRFLSPARLAFGPRRFCIVFLFDPAYPSARPTLAALDRLLSDYPRRIDVAALSPAPPQSVAAVLRDLDLGFPVLSSCGEGRALGLAAPPGFALMAPDGRLLGYREGLYNWDGPEARRLVDLLVSLFPAEEDGGDAGRFAPGIVITPESAYLAPPRPPALAIPGAWSFLGELESSVVDEINLARSNPGAYAAILRDYRGYIHGRLLEVPGFEPVSLAEGRDAVEEAIGFLERQASLPALFVSRGLSLAARDLVVDQGRSGSSGNEASDGSSSLDRMTRYGAWTGMAGEDVSYGPSFARAIVVALIVDDGLPTRLHRANIFSRDYSVMGLAAGRHPVYGTVCVIDFAWAYREKQ